MRCPHPRSPAEGSAPGSQGARQPRLPWRVRAHDSKTRPFSRDAKRSAISQKPRNWLIWAATTLTLLAALTSRSIAITRIQEPRLLGFDALLGDLTSAALLGTAVTAMLLGHSYLIAPGMSLTPLMRLLTALFV